MSFRQQPDQHELRAIVPLVFYQGERSWSYSSEFADLFAEQEAPPTTSSIAYGADNKKARVKQHLITAFPNGHL